MNTIFEKLNQTPVSGQTIEIVERKGIGHPDSLTDGICEASSRIISDFYFKEKGFILHHNLDKGLLIGGTSDVVFGGGKIIEPPDVIVAGTATILGNIDDIKKLIYEEVEKYLDEKLRFTKKLNPEIRVRIHPGSNDLVSLYERFSKGEVPFANDTSFGVGFYPFSELEKTVLKTENLLNSVNIKKKFPWIGEDIKVMGVRKKDTIDLTVAVAFVSEFVSSLEEYYDKKEQIKELIRKNIASNLQISINTADHEDSIYLTVSGTSWENGDDGQVGRGNRINGLITPSRVMSLEAAAGKNSVSHVGKLYNLKAQEIAEKMGKEFGIEEVHIFLVSQIGKPITEPFVGVKYIPNEDIKTNKAEEIIINSLSKESFDELTEKLLKNSLPVF